MSVFSIFNASFIGLLLVGIFSWNLKLIIIFFVLFLISLVIGWWDLGGSNDHYPPAFWLFILSEVIIFGGLFTCCFYYDTHNYVNLSSAIEIPFVGCFVLLSSSITLTIFHHAMDWEFSWILLVMTIILGFCFVGLQILEFNDIDITLLDTPFHATSFCTVGLHFLHVLGGALCICGIMIVGVSAAGFYRCTLITWYWHFVDYIWLFVYMIIYVC
uniref:cytochrome c oxidase subunit III n=1 Tax=Nippotaenia mogurndae TaxID=116902 RepID=UPI0021CC5897|nr:cytochrome c oxidase subunit III [Nippotaenia mogurndae]UWT58586.1 cytochrome c oxidase subunit 3 [Nippotaenia mogurndae]